MLRYSSPAATTASGVRNGRGSIGSRMSLTTAPPARFRAASCSGAGREVGWSYRTCLNRIREMERVLGAKVLATTRGGALRGGARLTPEARRLVKLFAKWKREAVRLSDVAFRRILPR